MTAVQVIARHTVSAGNEEEVLALLARLAEATREEPGNLAFDVYRRADDGRHLAILERYVSREALAAHRETPHFKDLLLDRVVPRLDERTGEAYDVE